MNWKTYEGDFKMHRTMSLLASAFLLMTLTACDEFSDRQVLLAAVPGDLRTCFGEVVAPQLPPPGQPVTRRQIVELVGRLRESEVARTQCGRRLLAFYDTQRDVYNRPWSVFLFFR
jgi:hypothetical protein